MNILQKGKKSQRDLILLNVMPFVIVFSLISQEGLTLSNPNFQIEIQQHNLPYKVEP